MNPAPAEASAALVGRTVLVVEDSEIQRAHAVSVLSDLGASRVLEAGDGLEGLEVLSSGAAVDLVLTDLEMPRMDGVAFIGELAARGYGPDLVILSAQDAPVQRSVALMARTYGLRVLGTVPKPLVPERLEGLLAGTPAAAPAPAAPSPEIGPEDIRRGLGEGEFLCFFQPQVTLQGAHLKGVEALARWRHPGWGLLGPAAFMPVVESRDDLIGDLTLAILGMVAAHWHDWRRKGLRGLEVSVNLSARSLGTAGFADRLFEAAERLDLDPRFLVFEVTESASVSDLGHTLANLARLRLRGYRLSIDDFGTGFATFEQLERIPFTELKLDRSIVMHLPASERHAILARRILQMARDLKLATVGEGVETLEQWKNLAAHGCERAQGYLIGHPVPGGQLGDWSKRDRSALRQEG
jgi:EAL domain-containing protein (putative c-di-GMP-specific phosphodiesterase class I)